MPSQISKPIASLNALDTATDWSPALTAIIGQTAPPVIGSTPAIKTFDLWGKETFLAFAPPVPNMGIPETSTLLGLKFLIYCQKSGVGTSYIDNDVGNGIIGLVAGTPDLEGGLGHELLVGTPRSNLDAFPAGVGPVLPAEVITLGADDYLWGYTAAALKAQLNNNVGGSKLHLFFDGAVMAGGSSDTRTVLNNAATAAAFGGSWTGDPATVIPANTIANGTASGWATKSVQSLTTNLQAFAGMTVDFGSIALDADLVVTGVTVRLYGQSVPSGGSNAGRVTVDGTSGGSKAVEHAGQMGITKGSAISYANMLANGGGNTYRRHIDNITTDTGNITVSEVLTFGSGANDAMLGFANSDALKAALYANTGSTKIGFMIDDGIFWKDGNNCTREIAAVTLTVYGHGPGDISTREIAAVICVATYSNPTLAETCEQICTSIWATYQATQTRHSIRLYVPTATEPNKWAAVDPAAAGGNSTVYANQFHHEVDCSSYAKAQRSARVLEATLNDYQASSLDCTGISAGLGVREITPPT